jgi:WD40 repeat protein/energy-coupling factor transporter ATP-binding protein EcfA2/Na+-transporting methylmalonyl-CoA/oxaloacetate decarboxylase gamma subunit
MLKQPLHTGEFEKPLPETLVDVDLRQENPFPGLRPFSIDECHLFFGREGQVDEILVKLSKNRFVTVMGYSGSGKSSLMYCGLVPVLYGGFMTQTGPHWNAISTRPGSSPINYLADSIIDQLIATSQFDESDRAIHKAIITSVLRSGPQGLVEVARYIQSQKGENIFLLIDQFEELLRFKDNQLTDESHNEAQQYVNLILTAVKQNIVPVYIAVTMRSDFIGNCSVFPGLTQWINHSNYLVPQLTREQKKMVIEGPVAVAGGRISGRLVKRLLSDVGNNQDQLPILQHALMRTWDYWLVNREPGEPLDLRHYQATGKISEALSLHANEAYDELTTRGKEIAEVLFKNITEKNQENKGMRRPGRLGLIALLAEAEEEDVVAVVDHFRKAGRSFLMPAANIPLNSDSMIELSHESLMRIWKRLSIWVDEEFESAQMYKRLSEAAAMYQIGKTGLWRPPDLQLALNWQKKQRPTREWAQRYDEAFERAVVFLDTSRITYEAELKNQEMLQRRVLRRTRATAVILGVAFVVAILFFLLSYIQKIKADEQTRLAEKERQKAQIQSELAIKQTAEANKQKLRAEKAAADLAKSYSALGDALAVATRERHRAEAALEKAREEEQKAIAAGNEEKAARVIASQQTTIAKEQFSRANALYMLAVAQTLATKSVQEDDDKDLKGLLAMQGYHYHRRYEGKKYDPYIYGGLYSSLKKINGATYNSIKTPGPPHVHIKSLVVSLKDNSFYSSGVDGRIMRGDFNELTSKSTGYATRYPSKVIALSPDEKYIVNGSDSSFIQIYDVSKNTKPLHIIKGLGGPTNDIEFLPGSSSFIIASADKTLSLGSTDGSVSKVVSLPSEVKRISISADGNFLAGATWNGQVLLVNLRDYAISKLVDDPDTRALSIKFSPDGNLLAFGLEDIANKRGIVKLYNLKSKDVSQFTGHKAGVMDVEFSPDGKLLASAGLDKRLLLWLLENPEDLPITMDDNNGFIWDIAFSKSSNYLIAACSESEIRVWPTDPSILASQICPKLQRNMTKDEWKKYVGEGEDIKYEPTCVSVLIED